MKPAKRHAWWQLGFFILFLLAAALLGPLRRDLPGSGWRPLALFVDAGIALGCIGWTAIWLTFLNRPWQWRLFGLAIAVVGFTAALLTGVTLSDGLGPISIKEAWAGVPGIPLLFFAVLLLVLLSFRNYQCRRSAEFTTASESTAQSAWGIGWVGFIGLLAVAVAMLARFPGLDSEVNWLLVIPIVLGYGFLVVVIAAWGVLKLRPTWVSVLVVGCHFLAMYLLLAGARFSGWIEARYFGEILSLAVANLSSIYLPLMTARWCGYRLIAIPR